MKKIALLSLAAVNLLNAEISFRDLYLKTGAVAGSVAGAGYVFSYMASTPKNAWRTQAAFAALGVAGAAYYYFNWHPDARFQRNIRECALVESNALLLLSASARDEQGVNTHALLNKLTIQYLDRRNGLYIAFQDILSLKKQCESLFKEARQLFRFYSLCFYKNETNLMILERNIEIIQPIIAILTDALVAIKQTPEYAAAFALQVEIEKQEAIQRLADAERSSHCSCGTSSVVVVTKSSAPSAQHSVQTETAQQ